MAEPVRSNLWDLIKKADLVLLALCLVATLFGAALIFSATRYDTGLHRAFLTQLAGAFWASSATSSSPTWI